VKYSLVKRMLIKLPFVRKFGARAYMMLPDSLSPLVYKLARNFLFRDNKNRESTFENAFNKLSKSTNKFDYLEFGVARGTSMIMAYHLANKYGLIDGRYFAFDSFEGLPNSEINVFSKGDMAYSQADFKLFCKKSGVDVSKISIVPGYYDKTLNDSVIKDCDFGDRVCLVHVDCDLYTSTNEVLSFLERFIPDKSIIIFDDWYNFEHMENPEEHGERKAFNEWKLKDKFTIFHTVEHWNIAMEFDCN
jgi:O-methyltransferase